MYLRNTWYIAAQPSEVGVVPLGRSFLGEPVVLFRDAQGRAAALADRCCHRGLPLSLGQVIGGRLQCGYHGLEFDADGTCVRVPGQARVPPGAGVRSYPVIERDGWVWIWMGDPDGADSGLVPDLSWRENQEWAVVEQYRRVECAYELLIDIQLDNTHAPFVHPDTLGSSAITDTPPKVRRMVDGVRAERWMMDVVPSPTFARALGTGDNVDRWLIWDFRPPSLCAFDIGCALAGTGAEKGDRSRGVTLRTMHFMTPETARSCHYFWSVGGAPADEAVAAARKAEFSSIFAEDVEIVEALQASREAALPSRRIDVNADAPVIQARTLLDRLIQAETANEAL